MNKSVSVIIRTKNEGASLPQVLKKIKSQDYEKKVEIIVVDSGSRDTTLDIAKSAGCIIVKLADKAFSFGRAINEGVKNAGADFIILVSGHTVPADARWLKNLVAGFDRENIAATFGRQIPIKGCDPFEEWQLLRNFPSKITLLTGIVLKGDAFSNASCAIRKDILLRYPFDENLPGCEDREWACRMKKMGYEIMYIPESKVFHSHRLSYEAVYERKFIQAKARKLTYPGACRYESIIWLIPAIIATLLVDIIYCMIKGYFRFLPKVFKYRCWYFSGLIKGAKSVHLDSGQ